MKKAQNSSSGAAYKDVSKPIELSINRILLARKTPLIFYPNLTNTFSKHRKTRHIKYTGKLACPQNSNLPSELKNLKRLNTLVIRNRLPSNDPQFIPPLKLMKALNPFRKYVDLVHYDSDSLDPSLFAHINYLSRLELMPTHPLLFEKVRFITRVRSLILNWESNKNSHASLQGEHRALCSLLNRLASFRYLKYLEVNIDGAFASKIASNL